MYLPLTTNEGETGQDEGEGGESEEAIEIEFLIDDTLWVKRGNANQSPPRHPSQPSA